MSDRSAENNEPEVKVTELPLLVRDEQGKLLQPLVPNWTNVAKRIAADSIAYANHFEGRPEPKGALIIEITDAESVKRVLENAGKVVYKSKSGTLPDNNDLTNLATYLDWSYQEQVGVPANASNQKEATEHGIGALDTWALFTSIRNKLSK